MLRMDNGTENGLIHDIQIVLRSDHEDNVSGERSSITGASTSNQVRYGAYRDKSRYMLFHIKCSPWNVCGL